MTKTNKTQIQFIYEWKQREEIYGKAFARRGLIARKCY